MIFFGFFVYISMQAGFNHHFRRLLPAFPFLFIHIAWLASRKFGLLVHAMLLIFLVIAFVESICSLPHSLSYINYSAGGQGAGPRWLLHSNVDWGQDLINLRNYIIENDIPMPVKVAYCGTVAPSIYNIRYRLNPSDIDSLRAGIPTPGIYAVSVNFVYGAQYNVNARQSRDYFFDRGATKWFRENTPHARVGGSIYIYKVAAGEGPVPQIHGLEKHSRLFHTFAVCR
ncbi:MAG: hypothetical protein JKY95_13980 [Planctomycetaceae bacterium]|nr:hypothetical protein [Planctomycetaceae bacterium]